MKFTKEQWQIMIKEQKESGLSKAEFCKSKNIPSSTFHSVVSRLELKKNQISFRSGGALGVAYHFFPFTDLEHGNSIGGTSAGISVGVIDFSKKMYHLDLSGLGIAIFGCTGGLGVRFGPDMTTQGHFHIGVGLPILFLFSGVYSDFKKESGVEFGVKLAIPTRTK